MNCRIKGILIEQQWQELVSPKECPSCKHDSMEFHLNMENVRHIIKWLCKERGPKKISVRKIAAVLYGIISWNMVIYILYCKAKEDGVLGFEDQKSKLISHRPDANIHVIRGKQFKVVEQEAIVPESV
ncbi:uncharacterized protein LOC116427388 [Nomia melanderi]|uniref:uncharacterized protein LOC116427388 n=1 Tax=Nomia melanderi TaxID=2448451 RepID=UPI003FCE3DD9